MNPIFYLLLVLSITISCQYSHPSKSLGSSEQINDTITEPIDSTLVDTATLQINLIPKGIYSSVKAEIQLKKSTEYTK